MYKLHPHPLTLLILLTLLPVTPGVAQETNAKQKPQLTVPVFKDGEAQIVNGFKDPDYWIRHDLWVETEFDSDNDGRLDRVLMAKPCMMYLAAVE